MAFRHFPLHPETPEAGLTLEQLFAGRNIDIAAAQRRMTMLMAEEGLAYGTRTMTYNSRLAQELAAWAVTQPSGARIHDALFRAYFEEGVNLAKSDNLVDIAQRLGLDAARATEVLETRSFREVVDEDWQRSRALLVTGVPTFVCGQAIAVGAQPYDVLEQLVIRGGAEPRRS